MPSSTAVPSPGESRPWSWGRSQAWWRSSRSWSWFQLWFLFICHCLGHLVQVLPGLMRSCRRRSRRRRPTGRHSSRCGRTDTGRGTQGLVDPKNWLFCTIYDGTGEHRYGWRCWTTGGSRQVESLHWRPSTRIFRSSSYCRRDIRQNIFSKSESFIVVRLESSGDDFLFLFDLIACTCGQVVLI